jgi:hypothetical protein
MQVCVLTAVLGFKGSWRSNARSKIAKTHQLKQVVTTNPESTK